MVLRLRRSADGALSMDGPPPEEHIFALQFLQRAIESGYARVTVALGDQDQEVLARYRVTGFTDEDGNRNATAWRCELMDDGEEIHDG